MPVDHPVESPPEKVDNSDVGKDLVYMVGSLPRLPRSLDVHLSDADTRLD